MQTSEQIDQLALALSKAQGEITGALKDSANPFFKSKYADLASCWDACREALSKHGLAVAQFPEFQDHSEASLIMTTTLMHLSGQWMRASLHVNPKDDSPQAMGSAITYARRYALCAVVGVAQVDDDAEAAQGRPKSFKEQHDISEETARKHALAMLAILNADPQEGDHDGIKQAMVGLDYHDKHLAGHNDLYQAVYEQMTAADRKSWKNMVEAAKKAEKAEAKTQPKMPF